MKKRDYYEVLGIPRNADEKKIKSAFRKLARKFHPDVNPGDKAAEEKFKEIQEAHDVLSDKKKRKLYDQFGHQGVSPGFDAEAAERMRRQWSASGGGGIPFDFGDAFRYRTGGPGAGFDFNNLGDLFGSVFGRHKGPMKGQDLSTKVEIGFREALKGTEVRLRIESRGRPRNLTVKIPPGVKTGTRVRVAGKGAPGRAGGQPGDLYVETVVRDDPLFKRDGDDLYCEIPITFSEAVLGTKMEVPTPYGPVQLKVPAGTNSGRKFRLKGKGAPRLKGSGKGDLYIRVMVLVPKDLDDRAREMVRELSKFEKKNPRRGIS
ncbi:MAG: DnaJ domain-containing protein [Deltaproteobacteria bacterium]|nr:DnaJ domain-containing protein [Deltaproteobacteria bacterium]